MVFNDVNKRFSMSVSTVDVKSATYGVYPPENIEFT